MSVINDALSKMNDKQTGSPSGIQRVEIKVTPKSHSWRWLLVGIGASLALGAWAVSQQHTGDISSASTVETAEVNSSSIQDQGSVERKSESEKPPLPAEKTPPETVVSVNTAPTAQLGEAPTSTVASLSPPTVRETPDAKALFPASSTKRSSTRIAVNKPNRATSTSPRVTQGQRAPQGSVSDVATKSSRMIAGTPSGMQVERVELSSAQLAAQQIQEAEKAQSNNDFQTASKHYAQALRLTPDNERVRQNLAALYYGRGNTRKAFDLLREGIDRNKSGETLRIALAKFLLKENQTEAALVPLVYLPSHPSLAYLSLRAALAQKSDQDKLALESYRMLVKQDANNGRWWLGLAIQQERSLQLKQAQSSYQNALHKVGVSQQSQQFIRERLKLLSKFGESTSAN
ncbi:hypothetical protein L4C34_06255 [Vibrio profundum]|uniref:tetratricopeptide repeat protein n=1 Tax=Vibrio profundum TaxID=2910247 RepID=UPI003D0B4819